MSKYVIIGSCIAAVGAVEGIRSRDPEGQITVIDGEGRGAYTRPLISYYLCNPAENGDVTYRSPDIMCKYGALVVPGRAISINRAVRKVELKSGESISYDQLLIATGAAPVIPAFPGVELDWVNTFYKMDDVEVLNQNIQAGMTAVVIGSGLIGMKAAEALCRRGMQVTVIEKENHILPALLSPVTAALLEQHLNNNGITCICSAEVKEINEEHKVVLSNGDEFDSDQVIIAVGAKPATEIALSCGLQVTQGIVVDENMRTSDEIIFAAGDVTETLNRQTGRSQVMALLPHAHREGYVAGCNMAGAALVYKGSIPCNSVKLMGLHICVAGSQMPGRSDTLLWEDDSRRLELQLNDGKLCRYMAINLPEIAGPLTYIIENEFSISPDDWQGFINLKPALEHIPGLYWEKMRGDELDVVA